jgi:hypothetical protein
MFDVLASAAYGVRALETGEWVFCPGRDGEPPMAYLPLLKACPRCSVVHNDRVPATANKPPSDTIGEIANEATLLILMGMIEATGCGATVKRSTDRRGDVDFVIESEQFLALAETKSSPLTLFPLATEVDGLQAVAGRLELSITTLVDEISESTEGHSSIGLTTPLDAVSLYIPSPTGRDTYIPLGSSIDAGWPYRSLAREFAGGSVFRDTVNEWALYFAEYANRTRGSAGTGRRWLNCGCGGGVDDSKNAPGLDRTDDIKKGTYQVLKLGAHFKPACPRRAIKTVLASNLIPLRAYDRYLRELEDLVWATEQGDSNSELFNLYDAILGFSRSHFKDSQLEDCLGLSSVTDAIFEDS